MTRILAYAKTVKFYAAMLGAGATAAGGVIGAPAWLLTVGAVLTGVAVFEIPYQPMEASHAGSSD